MKRSLALSAEGVTVNLVWRRRRRGRGRVDRLRRLAGSVETGSRTAFANINFEVKRGECVGIIIGGKGNDQLLGQVLTGKLAPDSGTVSRSGRWIFSPAGRGLMVGGLSLGQNVNLVAGLLGYPGSLPKDLETSILESVNASSLRNRATSQVPVGILRQITTMTALHLPADVYCLVGSLGSDFGSKGNAVQSAINKRIANGATVIAISQKPPGIPVDRVIDVVTQQRGQ